MSWSRESRDKVVSSVVGFIGGTVLTGTFAASGKTAIPWDGRLVNIVIVAFVLLAIFLITATRIDIVEEIDRARIAMYVRYKSATQEGDREIYNPIIRRMRDAKSSIRIMGSFRESASESSASRKEYYTEMYSIVTEKIKKNRAFFYERIVQVNEVRAGRVLHRNQVDAVLFQHCVDLLEEVKAGELHLRQVEKILPSLTLVIIDDSDVIICLPHIDRDGSDFSMQQLGTALFFKDREGTFWREMGRTFRQINQFASEIESTAE
jgi:hypothetical protein